MSVGESAPEEIHLGKDFIKTRERPAMPLSGFSIRIGFSFRL
jgi:hypothetical protein